MRNKPNADQIAYAWYLDWQYGRQIARNYLRLVTHPSYMSKTNLGKAKQSFAIAENHRYRKAKQWK